MILQKNVTDINNAIRNLTKLHIQERLQDTLDIPPLSETAKQIISLRTSPSASIEKLSAIVEMDPSLSAQIIGWASSAYYAAPGKINSVHDAIVRVLGYDLVLNIASGIAIGSSLRVANQKEYWLKAVWTASLADKLGTVVCRTNKDFDKSVCYLAGLLHNFGYLIVCHVFTAYSNSIQDRIGLSGEDRETVERDILGVTGNQLSSSLLQEWGLPEVVTLSIAHQNDPLYSNGYSTISRLLNVSVQILKERGLYEGESCDYSELLEQLNIDKESVDKIMESLLEKAEGINKIANDMI